LLPGASPVTVAGAARDSHPLPCDPPFLRRSGQAERSQRTPKAPNILLCRSSDKGQEAGLGNRGHGTGEDPPTSESSESCPDMIPADAGARLHTRFRSAAACRFPRGRASAGEDAGADRRDLPSTRPGARRAGHEARPGGVERGLGPAPSRARLLRRAVGHTPSFGRKADAEGGRNGCDRHRRDLRHDGGRGGSTNSRLSGRGFEPPCRRWGGRRATPALSARGD